MRRFIWEDPRWPALYVEEAALSRQLAAAAFGQGSVAGALRALGLADRGRVQLEAFAETALDTSAIEGEALDPESVRASLARRLSLERDASGTTDARADGAVAVTLDATRDASEPVTAERLFAWHHAFLPDAPRGLLIGAWRTAADDPMQVVSGPVSARVIHFEAPPAVRVPAEMAAFIDWCEAPSDSPPLVRAALAHLSFETIHPFADGNGRIGRALADLMLARGNTAIAPYVSLSRQIRADRSAYYAAIEKAQRGAVDATPWARWFIDCYRRATDETLRSIDGMMRASMFWRDHADAEINARQRRVLERYLAGGFEGWISARNYTAIAKTSDDTAQRDLAALAAQGIILANPGKARKTSYRLRDEYDPHTRT